MANISVLRDGPFSSRTSFTGFDFFVCAIVLALCGLPFFLYERAPDFVNDDVYYVDLADSLLHQRSYVANFAHEGVQPPGLPVILAAICATIGCTHDILTRSMSVFFALGLLFSYEVIRRQRGRFVAAVSCLLTAASPSVFPWVTSRLWPTFPYFAFSMLVFLLVPKLEVLERHSRRIFLVLMLCFLLTAAVITESIGTALIAAMLAWLLLSFFVNRGVARSRLTRLLPVALLALFAEVLWMQQGSNARDWPLPGRGESYLAQLRLKSGNHPELGFASPKDIVVRVEKNLKESTVFLGEALLHRWIRPSWTSPLLTGIVILILCGVLSSLWQENGQLCALYFIFYGSIYLLWPWFSGVVRFAVAVLPLACLYFAEGVLSLRQWSRQYPRRIGALFLPLSLVLASFASAQIWNAEAGHGLQAKISVVFWITCAVLCGRLIWRGRIRFWDHAFSARLLDGTLSVRGLSFGRIQILMILAVVYLVATGVIGELAIGRENLDSGYEKFKSAPEIQAARWIKSHTDPNVVVAVRQVGLIYHYSKRKEIWFPPITDPKILMRGILDRHIRYVIVVDRKFSYYIPPEAVCFDLLSKAYPYTFQVVYKAGQLTIYEVSQSGQPTQVATGPLRVLSTNPHYFTDGSGKAIYQPARHTRSNFQDKGTSLPPPQFDYAGYLDFLVLHNMNFFRLYEWTFSNGGTATERYLPYSGPYWPWQRVGPGNANDGKPKTDFTKFDQNYFDRMRQRVIQAGQKGIYVAVMLFNSFEFRYDVNAADGNPFERPNNVNGIDCTNTCPIDFALASATGAWKVEQAYIRKVIDSVNDLDNVLYEVGNEPPSPVADAWQAQVIRYVKWYESTKPKRHPVGITAGTGSTDDALYASEADWVAPGALLASSAKKVIVNDTDHSCYYTCLRDLGDVGQREWAWENFTSGNNLLFMDPYLVQWDGRNSPGGLCMGGQCTAVDPYWNVIRDALGQTRMYANKTDLAAMAPRGTLSSTGYCLANPGSEYLIYKPGTSGWKSYFGLFNRSFTVDMMIGNYDYEWYNPRLGVVAKTGSISVQGRNESFRTPFNGDAVLYLKSR